MSLEFQLLCGGVIAPDLRDNTSSLVVEQSLDEPSRYTLRIAIDLDPTTHQYLTLLDPRLRPGADLAIVVLDLLIPVCLVQGPIDRLKLHVEAGDKGSYLEVSGGDRRVEMDRQHQTFSWPGRDTDIASLILLRHKLIPDVAQTTRVHTPLTGMQNQSATDLAFLNKLARRNGFHFWISYEVAGHSPVYVIAEVGHFAPSPPRPDVLPTPLVDVVPGPRLEINLGARNLPTMTSIDVEVDLERPTMGLGLRDGEALNVVAPAALPLPPNLPLGPLPLTALTPGVLRDVFLTTAGDPPELQTRIAGALSEAEWFVNASATVTRHSLGGRIVQTHKLLSVVGLGALYSGLYFVTGVTHTIDTKGHSMDVSLARNALGGA
jgi:hypothetical protein